MSDVFIFLWMCFFQASSTRVSDFSTIFIVLYYNMGYVVNCITEASDFSIKYFSLSQHLNTWFNTSNLSDNITFRAWSINIPFPETYLEPCRKSTKKAFMAKSRYIFSQKSSIVDVWYTPLETICCQHFPV